MTEPATASSKVSSWSVASSAMLARSSSLADISRPGSEKMHRSLAVIIQRIIDRRNNSRLIAAKCGASMRPSFFFNKLPPEIRGLIYEFAYESEGGFIKAKLNRSAPPYPRVFKCAFDPIMTISKAWYNEAFDIFMRSRLIHFNKFEDLEEFSLCQPDLKKNLRFISWRQPTRMSWPLNVDLREIAPRVDSLHLFIGFGEAFGLGKHRLPGDEFFRSLRGFRGLKFFHATIQVSDYDRVKKWIQKAYDDGSFDASVAEYCRKVREEVTNPRRI